MSATFTVPNFDRNIKEQSSLAAAASAGSTSLTLLNNNNIQANDPVLLGELGSETAEVITVNSASGATIVTSTATTLDHVENETVTALIGSKIRLYRAVNVNNTIPDDGSFAIIGTVNIDADQLTTTISDTSGGNGFWYKFTYYNPNTDIESDIAASIPTRPGVVNYVTLSAIRGRAGFRNNPNITDVLINAARATAEDHINSRLTGRYVVPFTSPISPTITEIAKMYAAGILLSEQYPYATGGSLPGDDFITWADKQLDSINSGDTPVIGATGTSTAVPSLQGGFSGFPNSPGITTTGPLGQTVVSEGFMFERSDIDGYETRRY